MKDSIVNKPWGYYEVLYADADTWLKRLVVHAGQRLSAQRHQKRAEYWQPLDVGGSIVLEGATLDLLPGKVYYVPVGAVHRLVNTSDHDIAVIEWAIGQPDENDIERLEDDYGR